jgi:diacylglycerol kinase (CTP)
MVLGGTEREIATNARDMGVQQPQQPRHRSRPPRSPSLTHSPSNAVKGGIKRSPSPIISFHPAPLLTENTKGVKNITRKVIKRLEGLGHLDMVNDLDACDEEEEPEVWPSNGVAMDVEEREVEKVLYALGRESVLKEIRTGNGIAEKHSPKPKPNLEIPRKVLHSSIGLIASSILLILTDFSNKVS